MIHKLSKHEFWNLTKVKKVEVGIFLITQTDICKYGQVYNDNDVNNVKERYLDFYYTTYLNDFERESNNDITGRL